jgi:hypothetical protein
MRRIEVGSDLTLGGLDKLMKSANRKILMTLIGLVLAAPFLAIASVVGVHAAALADNVRVDMVCVGLALASVAVRIIDQHLALRTEESGQGNLKSSGNTLLRKSSIISPRY